MTPKTDRTSRRVVMTSAQFAAIGDAAQQQHTTVQALMLDAIGLAVARTGIEWPDDYRDERRRQEAE